MVSLIAVLIASVPILYFILPKILIRLLLALEPAWKKKIPGPYPSSFLTGALSDLKTIYEVPGRPMIGFDRVREKYGDFVLLRGGLVIPDILLMSDPAFVNEALASKYKGKTYDALRIINENDLLTSDGPYWHRQRKLMNPMFSTTAIKDMYHVMLEELKQLTAYFDQQDLAKSINMTNVLQKVTLDVLTSAAFGVNYGALHGANKDAIDAMSKLLHEVELRTVDPIGHRLNPMASRRLSQARTRVRALAKKCLDDRKNNLDALNNRKDLLNMMIHAEDPESGQKMTEDEIISENVIFLVAGHDTTAHSMSWFFYHTAMYPEWQVKIQQEVDEVLRGKEYPAYDDLSQMVVLDKVIKESMRMTPVTPSGSARELKEDVMLGDYFVGKGTAVMVSIHLMHHNSKFWKNPSEFNPERFTDNQSHFPNLMPFSAGPRNCIGQMFAKVEMRAVMGTMAKYLNWRLDPNVPVIPIWAVSQKPKDGLFLYLSKRASK